MVEILRYALGGLFIVTGVLHFVRPQSFTSIMPPYVPFPQAAVFVSGMAELGLGIAVMFRSLDPWPAWGLIALLVAVFPANVHMALHPELFSKVPRLALYARLPMQALLIYWAWSYTRLKA